MADRWPSIHAAVEWVEHLSDGGFGGCGGASGPAAVATSALVLSSSLSRHGEEGSRDGKQKKLKDEYRQSEKVELASRVGSPQLAHTEPLSPGPRVR